MTRLKAQWDEWLAEACAELEYSFLESQIYSLPLFHAILSQSEVKMLSGWSDIYKNSLSQPEKTNVRVREW